MQPNMNLVEKLKCFGVGHRKLGDELFINDEPPSRLGVYDLDEENLCHEVIKTVCNIPGCEFTAESLLEFENHYNASHRYTCGQCKKILPSPHLLDLHVEENHDSFFVVMSEKRPSYCCYIEECKDKFMNASDRLDHCIKVHKLPKDFRFEQKVKNKSKSSYDASTSDRAMNLDDENTRKNKYKFLFTNSKQKTFPKYIGRKFTKNDTENKLDVNMEDIVADLKGSLPQ